MKTDGSNFKVDPKEFHNAKWMSIPQAKIMVGDIANQKALDTIENNPKLYSRQV